MIQDFKWFDERARSFPNKNWLYQIICFLYCVPKKKMTYRQIFLFFYGLNKKDNKLDRQIEDFALAKTIMIYAHNNHGKIPDEFLEMIKNKKDNM